MHQAELDLAEALPAELGIGRWAAHSPRSRTCSCSGAIGRAERVVAELAEDRLDRPDLLAHERAHPVQLLPRTRARSRNPRPCDPPPSGSVRRSSLGWGPWRRTRCWWPRASRSWPAPRCSRRRASASRSSRAPLLFAALEPQEAIGTAAPARHRDRPAHARRPRAAGRGRWRATRTVLAAAAVPAALAGVAVLRSLDAVALQVAVTRRRDRDAAGAARRGRARGAGRAAALGGAGGGVRRRRARDLDEHQRPSAAAVPAGPRRPSRASVRDTLTVCQLGISVIGAAALALTAHLRRRARARAAGRFVPLVVDRAHRRAPAVPAPRGSGVYEPVLTGVARRWPSSTGLAHRGALSLTARE